MADVDLEDADFGTITEGFTINRATDNDTPNVAELKKKALSMYDIVQLPVYSDPETIVGAATAMSCTLCKALVFPDQDSLVTHMRQHLKAERRGEYNNA